MDSTTPVLEEVNICEHVTLAKEISDYRPISVSIPLCTLFELLLKQRMPFLEDQHSNQFGYKRATSCKLAYCVRLLATTSLGDLAVISLAWMQPKRLTDLWEMDYFINSCLGLKLVCGEYCISSMMRALLSSMLKDSDLLRSK